jgi:hypothetical protein
LVQEIVALLVVIEPADGESGALGRMVTAIWDIGEANSNVDDDIVGYTKAVPGDCGTSAAPLPLAVVVTRAVAVECQVSDEAGGATLSQSELPQSDGCARVSMSSGVPTVPFVPMVSVMLDGTPPMPVTRCLPQLGDVARAPYRCRNNSTRCWHRMAFV